MRRLPLIAVLVVLPVFGCQYQHQQNKQAAQQRWNQARTQIGLEMAQRQFQSGQLKQAALTAQNVVASAPEYLPGHLLLGRIYLEQNRLVPAQQCFETSLKIDPSNAQAHYGLGVIFEKRFLIEKALAAYHLAWNFEPAHSAYLLALVEMLVSQDRAEQALDLLTGHIEDERAADPDASVYAAAGNIFVSLNRPVEAVRMFRKALNLAPENRFIVESLAYALHSSDQPKEAVGLFERLRREAEADSREFAWSSWLALGDCYMKLGRYYPAQQCFERVSEHDTSNPAVWTRLAQTALARGDLDRASIWAGRSLSLESDYPDALIVLGYVAIRRKQYSKAEDIFNQIISIDETNITAYCLLGQVCEARGFFERAAEYYARALRIDPRDELARKLMLNVTSTQLGKKRLYEKF